MPDPAYIAFEGSRRIAAGSLADVTAAARRRAGRNAKPVVAFNFATGHVVDLDLRPGAPSPSPPAEEPRGPGRPRLGVVPREVTLLPRHWEWLAAQPGGASVALRKLVDEARQGRAGRDIKRAAREAAYRFMTVIAGDLPQYEDATRALFAGDKERFTDLTERWPEDIRDHARRLAAPGLA